MKIVSQNDFGNLIVEDIDGKFWRLCPEDVYCEIIALNNQELEGLFMDEEFVFDWRMDRLVKIAHQKLGDLKDGYKYCLVFPTVLGGAYEASNINTAPLLEMISFSGSIGEQIKDLPDGAQVKIDIVD